MTSGLVPTALREELVELRRSIHQEPELAFQEKRTAEKLERALKAVGVADVQRVAETGVVGRIPGTKRGSPVTAIRGDIDRSEERRVGKESRSRWSPYD